MTEEKKIIFPRRSRSGCQSIMVTLLREAAVRIESGDPETAAHRLAEASTLLREALPGTGCVPGVHVPTHNGSLLGGHHATLGERVVEARARVRELIQSVAMWGPYDDFC